MCVARENKGRQRGQRGERVVGATQEEHDACAGREGGGGGRTSYAKTARG